MRTRFAPSPTGYLHIGGVRTALFNWLLARQSGGQFILRIDDTDAQRNVEAALQPILDGFQWLGIAWDEGPEVGGPHAPYFQSQRQARYAAAVAELLAAGAAYRDFARPEEVQAERAAAEAEKREFVYSRRWMATDDEHARSLAATGRPSVVRLKMPRSGDCQFDDLVCGPLRVAWSSEADHVIQRADGTYLYHLASVVDDADFGITHVVRAQEHLSNTPRQIFIAQSLGYSLPQYAHLPVVAEPGSKVKLSKRKIQQYLKHHDFKALYERALSIAQFTGLTTTPETFNPVVIDFYRQVGFLPDAILNYLLLLGWSLDDHTEFFSRQDMIQAFSLDRVVKSPASFDPVKLLAFQQHHMNRLPLDDKVAMCLGFLQQAGWVERPSTPDDEMRLRKILLAAGERIVIAGDILSYDELYVADDRLTYDEAAFTKRLVQPPEAGYRLAEFKKLLVGTPSFDADTLHTAMRSFVEQHKIGMADIVHAVRIAVTGKPVGFGLFDVLEIIGRESCIRRIDRALARLDARRAAAAVES